jgi:hypothetical protein
MSVPVRYPSGVTNVQPSDACRNLPFPSFTRLHYIFDDFDWFQATAEDLTGGGSPWAAVTVADGVFTIKDGDGGQLRIATGTTDNAVMVVRTQQENFTMEAGSRLWFGIRLTGSNEVTESDWFAGLSITDASPIASTPANYLAFHNDDGDTNIDISMVASGTSVASATAIATAAADTFQTLEFEFDGVDTVHYFVDGVLTGSLTSSSFPTTEMGITIALQAGSNSALADVPYLDIDWVYAAKERTTVNT